MTGKSRRPREDGTRESKQGDQEKTLLFVGRVLGHGWMYKEEERKDGWIPGNLPISPRGGSPYPTMPPLPHFQLLPTTWAKRDKLPSARQSVNQSVRGGIIQ